MLMPLYSGGTLSSHMDNMPQDVYMLGHMPKNVAEILSFLRDVSKTVATSIQVFILIVRRD